MPVDPVCKMSVGKEDVAAMEEYKGNTYYFCSDECREEFDKNPGRFAEKKRSAAG